MSRDVVMTSGGLSLIADYLAAPSVNNAPDPPSFVIIGSGTQPVERYQTGLPGHEQFRTSLTNRTAMGDQVAYHLYLDTSDQPTASGLASMTVRAYGLVAGSGIIAQTPATLASGTGTVFALANEAFPYSKSAGNIVSRDITLTLSGTQGGGGLILTSGGLQLIRNYLAAPRATDAPSPPTYVAISASAGPAGHFQTSVPGFEIRRVPISDRKRQAQAGAQAVLWHFRVAATDALDSSFVGSYGVMAGEATTASGTGTLLAVYSASPFQKTTGQTISGILSFTVSGTLV